MTVGQRRCLVLILVVGGVVRLGWAVFQSHTADVGRLPDQLEYLTLGRSLLHTGSLRLFDARFGQTVVAYRLPGYPALIAACGGSPRVVRLVQACIDLSTVGGVFVLARRVSGGVPDALLAAAVLAANPFYIYFSGLILTETTFAAAVVWSTVAASRRAWPATLVLFVAAVYLRPTALILAPVLVGLANWTGRRPYQGTAVITVVGAMCVALVPWAVRNKAVIGSSVWTTTNDGVTLYDGFHDGATGGSDQRFLAGLPGLRSMNEVDRSRELSRRARRWVAEHPKELIRLTLRKITRGWSPVPLSAEFGRPLFRWVGGGYAVPFDLLCLIGLASRRLAWRAKLLLVAPAVVLTGVQAITVGSIRYRMPAEAFGAVLAGVGAVDVWQLFRRSPVETTDAAADLHPSPPV